jgi:kinetochore protein NDC80
LLRKELANLESAVAAQNLSPEEVMRMTNERESLQRQLDEVRIKVAEAKQQSYDHEMLVTKAMDRFEQLLQDYTALGDQIGILDSSNPGGPGPNGVDYSLDLDITAQDAQEVQRAGKRMRDVIWPALQTYSEGFRKQALELGNGAIALEDELDQLTQKSERQKEEIANLDAKLRIETAKADDAKAVSAKLRIC